MLLCDLCSAVSQQEALVLRFFTFCYCDRGQHAFITPSLYSPEAECVAHYRKELTLSTYNLQEIKKIYRTKNMESDAHESKRLLRRAHLVEINQELNKTITKLRRKDSNVKI